MGGFNLRRQEVGVILTGDLSGEVLGGKAELVTLRGLGGKRVGALGEKLEGVRLVNLLAFGGGDAMADPLPKLAAGDLGSGGILPVDGGISNLT